MAHTATLKRKAGTLAIYGTDLLAACTKAARRLKRDKAMTSSAVSAGFMFDGGKPRGQREGVQVFVTVARYSEALLKRNPASGGLVTLGRMRKALFALPLLLCLSLLAGCLTTPLRGGKATSATPAIAQTLQQGENPAATSAQRQASVKTRNYTLPAGSAIEETIPAPPGDSNAVPVVKRTTLAEPMPVTEREETKAETELGAAQKDMAREVGAKLASLRGITWLGVVLLLFGIASFVWAPLRLLINSTTTSIVIAITGLGLLALPTLLVGNELAILLALGGTATAWFLAHRYGHMRGMLDANKDGIDDRLQTQTTTPATPPPAP